MWSNKRDLVKFLDQKGCSNGLPGSGNYAMFCAIFLTYQYEKTGHKKYLKLMKIWFDYHNSIQNKDDGFWGNSMSSNPYIRFQNSFHQIIIYEYWKEDLNFSNIIVDKIISICDFRGQFAPWPGGGGCYDYDAIHILIKYGIEKGYRIKKIKSLLNNTYHTLLNSQNFDSGFCESKYRPKNFWKIFTLQNLIFFLNSKSFEILYQRLRHTYSVSRNSHNLINNHWSSFGHSWSESDIWNTWFRSLAVAEISRFLNFNNTKYNFQDFIGLGFNRWEK